MNSGSCRKAVLLVALAATAVPAAAQQPRSAACTQLEAQLATFDKATNDPARVEQIQRLEEAINRQQAELNRNLASSQRLNCEGGFFLLFSGKPAQCGPLSAQIQTQRTNIDRMRAQLESLQSLTAPEHQSQRHAILVALSQNNCGPQYRTAAAVPPPRGSLFDSLFGPNSIFTNPGPGGPGGDTPMSGTFRTICVRTCDGFYWPVSYAASPARFPADAQICARSCPAAQVELYAHHNPGEDVNQAVSTTTQQPYTALPNAFRYRTAFDAGCSCRQPGETWAHALKTVEDPLEQGDVVVTEERARQMSQPRVDAQGKPIKPDLRPSKPAVTTPTPAASTVTSPDGSDKPDPNRKVRAVGPTFISK